MGKLLPVILALLGLAAGAGAGFMLRPAPEGAAEASHEAVADCAAPAHEAAEPELPKPATPPAYVKLPNQFIVPIMGEKTVEATVIVSLSLEVTEGSQEAVFALEPKLRDIFLRVLFDHANAGGFDGNFLLSARLDDLRKALLEAAVTSVGPSIRDVLIVDLVKQQV
jgi:hypothetical protein